MNFVLVTIAILAGMCPGRTLGVHGPQQGLERTWQHGSLEFALSLSNASPFVSDDVAVRLHIAGPGGTEIEFPTLDALRKSFQINDIKRTGPTAESDGRDAWELNFKLEVLRAAETELPPLTVRYRTSPESDWTEAATDSIPIQFRSMLGPDAEAAEPRPNPRPIDWPDWFPWALAAFVVVVLVLLAVGAWIVRSSRSRRVQPIMRISPYRKALDGIRRIEEACYLERCELEKFYTELSGVIRHYIEDRFGLRAPEQTTEEFLQELTRQPVLDESQRGALATFLEQSDLVKFAKVRPTTNEGKSALNAARSFVERTRHDSRFMELASK